MYTRLELFRSPTTLLIRRLDDAPLNSGFKTAAKGFEGSDRFNGGSEENFRPSIR